MKPFSTFKFFKENTRKGIVTFIVLILSICGISLITVIVNSIYDTVNSAWEPFTKYSLVSKIDGDFYLNNSIVSSLKSSNNIEKLISCDISYTNISLGIGGGSSSMYGIFAEKSDIEYYLSEIGDSIKEGYLPQNNTNEIAVHWRVMSSKKWKLGQIVGSNVNSDENLAGSYKIVGILDGPALTLVGTQTSNEKKYNENGLKLNKPLCYAVFPKPGKLYSVNKSLDTLDKSKASVVDYSQIQKDMNESESSMNSTLLLIILIVVLILSISVGSLMYIVFLQRSNEFGILISIGYKRRFIYFLIFREILALNILSWITGMVITYFLVLFLNNTVYIPQGNILNFFNTRVFIYSLVVPIIVTLFSIPPIYLRMHKQDIITTIERRD